ncbi:hypothetical protein D3C71_2247240 [compost metagenome]
MLELARERTLVGEATGLADAGDAGVGEQHVGSRIDAELGLILLGWRGPFKKFSDP